MEQTKGDKKNATHIAHGLGIADQDITYIEDAPINVLERKIVNRLRKELVKLNEQGLRTLLYVYCAGHGIAD